MKDIKFSYNWNNKLNCFVFTTIRLENHSKYKIDEAYTNCTMGGPKNEFQESEKDSLEFHKEIIFQITNPKPKRKIPTPPPPIKK